MPNYLMASVIVRPSGHRDLECSGFIAHDGLGGFFALINSDPLKLLTTLSRPKHFRLFVGIIVSDVIERLFHFDCAPLGLYRFFARIKFFDRYARNLVEPSRRPFMTFR
jgi:hypothetical protein